MMDRIEIERDEHGSGYIVAEINEDKEQGIITTTKTKLDNVEEVLGAVRFILRRGISLHDGTCMVDGCNHLGTIRHPTMMWSVGEKQPLLCETHARTMTKEELDELDEFVKVVTNGGGE
jgi:hypothetical protein